MKAQWSGVKIKDMFPDAPVQKVSTMKTSEVSGPATSDVNLDVEPPPLVYDHQFTDFNESSSSSSKSIRLPRSMLREVAPPLLRQNDHDSEQELHSTPRKEELLDFVNNNAVSVNATSEDSEVLISSSDPVARMRAYSMLQNAPVGAKKFVPLSFVPEVEDRRDTHDRQIEVSAAVSAAMGAALPYFRGQADLEYQMRLLLEKVTHLEETKKASTILNDAREASAVNFERHLAELTEKRLELLERVMASDQKLDLKSKCEKTCHESCKQLHPVNYIENDDHKVPQYTKVPTEPRVALLAKSSSKSKKKESPSKQKVSNDSSILPRSNAPKPSTPSADLLSEIMKEQNDSSLHTINASIIEERERKQLDDSRARGAESKILDELSRLREELYSLKYKRDGASKIELINENKTPRSPQDPPHIAKPVFQEELMPNLTKPQSQLFDQYFQEYSKVYPFKHDQEQSLESLVDGPAQVLKEAEAFRRNIVFNDRVAAKNLEIREVHRRIDDLCRNIPEEYLKMRENVDFRIQRIRKDVENELSDMNFEAPKQTKEQPKAKGKFFQNPRGTRVALKEPLPKSYAQKPVASVKPNGHRVQTSLATLRQTVARKQQVAAETPVTISPAQLAYQNLILERQREYLQKMEAMQHVPPGSNIQSAGLVYNKNFYPIKGQVLKAAPETREVATETKFGVEKEIQTTEPPRIVKRVDFETVVSGKLDVKPEKRLAIENLPEVVIECEEKEQSPEEVKEIESSVEEPSVSDVIIAPGYRKPEYPPRPPVESEDKNRAFSRVQACIEDEIVSNILRKIITGPPTEPVNQTESDEETDESSLSPENELILQIFIDAGINIDKRLVRKIGEEEIMKMILALMEEQKQNKLKEDLAKCNVGTPKVPTPSRTPREYSPEVSEKEWPVNSPRPVTVRTQLIERGVSPIVQASETLESSSSDDDFMAHVEQNERTDHFIPTPQPNVETPERTPPMESPESSVVEVSITSEVPPSPEKTAPAKIPEPAVPPVIVDDTDYIDIGVQYEAPPSFTNRQTSPIVFSIPPEQVLSTTESSSTSSSDNQSVYTPTTEEPMSDHEWVVPHEVLRSEGEFTPPHRVKFEKMLMPAESDMIDDADAVTRSSLSQLLSEGEVRPTRPTHWSEIRGPVTEALYEMKHLMAASNQKSSTVPKVERRRFKPYSSQGAHENLDNNVSGIEITGLGPSNRGSTDVPVGMGVSNNGAESSTSPNDEGSIPDGVPENVRFVEPHPPDTERSSTGARSSRKQQSNEDSNIESARTSSAYKLPLDALNTEESISDIEDVL